MQSIASWFGRFADRHWRAACVAVGLSFCCATSNAAHAGPDPAIDWRAWHLTIAAEGYRNSTELLKHLRQDLADAQRTGDRHLEWMTMSWLASDEAWSSANGRNVTEQKYERAISDARAAGDKAALFHLILMVEWTRTEYLKAELRQPLIDEAMGIARELGDPMRVGLIERMLGNVAARNGLHGEALAHYRIALETLTGGAPRAEALCLIARSVIESQSGMPALTSAEANLKEAISLLNPAEYGAFSLPYSTLAKLYVQMGRPEAAVESARLALKLIQQDQASVMRIDRARLVLAAALVADQQPQAAIDELAAMRSSGAAAQYEFMRLLSLAEADAQLQLPDALALLSQAQQILPEAITQMASAAWEYHEAAARIRRLRGDFGAALDEMAAATQARQSMVERTSRRLFETKLQEAESQREVALLKVNEAVSDQRRRFLLMALSGAVLALGALGYLLYRQARQSRQLAALSGDLKRANEQLTALNETRTRWLAGACHDLRQPAHALGMLAELARARVGESDEQRESADDICRATRVLSGMLDSMMDMAQLEGGQYRIRTSAVALQDIFGEVELEYGPMAAEKGLQLLLPATREWVLSDPYLLRRVVFNLVSNAIKYTEAGSVSVNVQDEGTGTLQLAIRDTGVGIPADKLTEVFGDYVRLNNDRADGLGIGLAIVRRSVGVLGHGLTVSSMPGRGTTMSLMLPRTSQQKHAELERQEANGRMVVVIDDDDVIRRSTAELLRHHGYRVVAVADRTELTKSLPGLEAQPPTLVIADMHLADSNGLDIIVELRSRPGWGGLPALLLTGDLDQTVLMRANGLGAAVAFKPLPPDRLLRRVAELLVMPPAD